jgi:hypothetical protein
MPLTDIFVNSDDEEALCRRGRRNALMRTANAAEHHLCYDTESLSAWPGVADVSAFPDMAVRSACASSFSRLARRSLALRPAHSRCHQFVTRYPKASAISFPPQLLRLLPAGAVCRVGLAPTGKRRLATAHASNRHCGRLRRATRFPCKHYRASLIQIIAGDHQCDSDVARPIGRIYDASF